MLRRGGVLALSAVCAVALVLTGCGGAAEVQGTISLNGQPIEKGSIAFVSQDGGASPLTVGQEVAEGKYSIGADRGLKPGQYKVEIYGNTKAAAPASADPDMQSSGSSNAVPAKYNSASELTAELTSGSNTVNFDLKP